MRGVVLESGRVLVRDDLEPPTPREGWTRVRVLRAGICATDQALARGYMGFRGVPGHEFVGMALDGPHAGRRVVGEINAACGTCSTCRAGDGRHCPQRTVLEIASLEKGIAKARAEAVEAARARRTLEILRDQRLSAFADGERRKEQGALDELGQQRAHAQTPNTHDGAVA